jgi:hypothetical protein
MNSIQEKAAIISQVKEALDKASANRRKRNNFVKDPIRAFAEVPQWTLDERRLVMEIINSERSLRGSSSISEREYSEMVEKEIVGSPSRNHAIAALAAEISLKKTS